MRDQPMLYADLEPSLNIFWELSAQRSFDGLSGLIGAIPFSEIEAYFRLHKIENYETTLERLKTIDRIYREIINERHKPNS